MENLTSGTHLRHFDVSTDWFDAISAYENFPEAFSGWSTKVTFTSLVILSQKKRVGSHNSQSLMKLYSEMFPSLEGMQITLNRGDIDLQLLNHFSRLSTLELTVTCSSDVEISRVFTRFVLPSICSTVKKFTFTLDFSFEMQKEMPQWKILSSFTNLVNLSLKCTTSLSVLDSIGFGELTPKLIKLSLDLSFWQHFGDNLSEIQNKANAFEMNNFQSIVEFFNCSVALKCAIISSKGTIGHYTYPLIEKVLKQPYIDSFDGQLNFAQVENLEVCAQL